MYFLGKKSDTANALESFLAEVRADGTPSAVMTDQTTRESFSEGILGNYAASVVSRKSLPQ